MKIVLKAFTHMDITRKLVTAILPILKDIPDHPPSRLPEELPLCLRHDRDQRNR